MYTIDPNLVNKPLPDDMQNPYKWTGAHTVPSIIKSDPSKVTKIAVRDDSGKTNWSLMPFEALEEINKVLEFGATKYSANNWQEGTGFKYSRVLNSLLRHVFAFMRGEDKDPESGLSHMAHAGCNVLFILYYLKNKARYANDDRR